MECLHETLGESDFFSNNFFKKPTIYKEKFGISNMLTLKLMFIKTHHYECHKATGSRYWQGIYNTKPVLQIYEEHLHINNKSICPKKTELRILTSNLK